MTTYSELLQNENWKLKRNERLIIDEFKCQNCFNDKLISKFKISAVSIGLRNKLTGKGLIFVVYDSELETSYRISADKIISYDLFLTNINKNSSGSPILLYYGKDIFAQIIGIFFTSTKINYQVPSPSSFIENARSRFNSVSKFLKETPKSELRNFKWIYSKGLHIHHKYYQKEKLPWQYPNDALITLCWECHENLHKNTKIPYLNEFGIEVGTMTPCSKCYGAGWFPEFNHIQNGICFKCNGAKYDELK
jgi:hypothetical protein